MYKIVYYDYSLVYLNKYISNKYKLTVEILHLNTFKCFFIYIYIIQCIVYIFIQLKSGMFIIIK